MTRPHVAIVGAGPSGLMAAEVVANGGDVDVTVFERMPSPARKLLLAGRGGLNLTHSEDLAVLLHRYGDATEALRPVLERFDPSALRRWCADLGVETFVGSSGRVFPVSFKTSLLLRAWLRRLNASGVRLALRHTWRGWDHGALVFESPDGGVSVAADATVLALGGASWPQLGSDGGWVGLLDAAGVEVEPLQPANCGFATPWSDWFGDTFQGEPLKNVALEHTGQQSRGDVVVTRSGLEGGALYQLSAPLRAAILRDGDAELAIRLRPDLTHEALTRRLGRRQPKQSFSSWLRKALNLPPVSIALLREASIAGMGAAPADLDVDALAALINAVPIRLTGLAPIVRAISTAGGVPLAELDMRCMVKRRPGLFLAGEMLDWEAPTGGYLLQACFATGAAAGRGVLAWLAERDSAGAGAPTIDTIL